MVFDHGSKNFGYTWSSTMDPVRWMETHPLAALAPTQKSGKGRTVLLSVSVWDRLGSRKLAKNKQRLKNLSKFGNCSKLP